MTFPAIAVSHPNATRAGSAGGAGILIVWLLGYAHVSLSAEEGAAVAAGASTIAVFLGNDGVLGAWHRLLYGKNGKAAAKPAAKKS